MGQNLNLSQPISVFYSVLQKIFKIFVYEIRYPPPGILTRLLFRLVIQTFQLIFLFIAGIATFILTLIFAYFFNLIDQQVHKIKSFKKLLLFIGILYILCLFQMRERDYSEQIKV